MLSDLRFRLRAIFNRRAMEQELDDELAAHIERETEKYVRQGMERAEAARRARLAFGGVDRIKEDTRDVRGTATLETIAQDLRYAWRGLRSKPGFTAAVVVTLGLGIGANTAMFGVVDRLLFRSPPFLRDADRVHRVFEQYKWNGENRTEGSTSYKRFTELTGPSFDRTAVVSQRLLDVGTGADAQEMTIAAVSATLFDFFSVRPTLGRYFTPDEDKTPSGAHVVVLGHDYWQSSFGGSSDVLGKSLRVGAIPYTIIGVAPRGFVGFSEGEAPVAYIPVTAFAYARTRDYFQNYNWTWLTMYARRRPGVSVEAATADLTNAYQRSWSLERESRGGASYPTASAANARMIVTPVHTARGPDAGGDSRVAKWVMGVTVIVLLIACANVANLLLARAAARRREMALRLALGVSTRRLLQQLLTESILLAALGGVAGLLLAQWGGRALGALFLPGAESLSVAKDGRMLLFGAVVTLVVALLTGLAPAVTALRHDVSGSLKAGVREGTYRRSRTRTALLLFQGALSVVLLVGAGLFVRSLNNVRAMRLGYDVEPVVAIEGRIRGVQLTPAEEDALGERLLSTAMSTPGVRSATFAASVPFSGNEGRGFPSFPGADTARIRRGQRYMLQAGTPQYFETVGTRILRGRGISRDDRANTPPVIIVNQAMAERLWPGEDPLGKQLRLGEARNPMMTVVGVAENMRGRSIDGDIENWYYLPWKQYRAIFGGDVASVLIRVNGRAEDYVSVLRRRLMQEMPGTPYVRAEALRALVAPTQRSWEFGATMFVAFGALALGLAAIGLYSVIAYTVAQRTHELGVRMALGASVRDVMRIVVGQGVTFAVAGIVIGSLIALLAGKWVEPLLFAQKARDPLVFAVVAGVLLVAALAATLGPAWRAVRVDPTLALRSD